MDGTVTPKQLRELSFPEMKLYELPREVDEKGNEKWDDGVEVMKELTCYIKKNWPGNEDSDLLWKGKELVLEKGALVTPPGRRNIIIPRPYPTKEDVVVMVYKNSKSYSTIMWESWEAYMLETGVFLMLSKGSIRVILLTLRCQKRDDEVGEEVGDDGSKAGGVNGSLGNKPGSQTSSSEVEQ
ncbi:hypothetical protein B0T10DRAFT_496088 [Thelonectria olida]|uniref:Uncharacterized protein n=1 Tax=Thelonectria olida TaxID=1576542 RepID=A0A9P9AMS4_9HYPO|nr:hypothetical protein B0T10DRAFT_496088 [Thelonectria olida]